MSVAGSGHSARLIPPIKPASNRGRRKMAGTYVLVHGAWHTGAEMDAVAGHLRKYGHAVHCPTVAGNNAYDDRSKVGLEQAIASVASYIEANDLRDIWLVGHSYGGMLISGVAD